MNCYDQQQCEELYPVDADDMRAAMLEDAAMEDSAYKDLGVALAIEEQEIAISNYNQWLADNPAEAQAIHDNHEAIANGTI